MSLSNFTTEIRSRVYKLEMKKSNIVICINIRVDICLCMGLEEVPELNRGILHYLLSLTEMFSLIHNCLEMKNYFSSRFTLVIQRIFKSRPNIKELMAYTNAELYFLISLICFVQSFFYTFAFMFWFMILCFIDCMHLCVSACMFHVCFLCFSSWFCFSACHLTGRSET